MELGHGAYTENGIEVCWDVDAVRRSGRERRVVDAIDTTGDAAGVRLLAIGQVIGPPIQRSSRARDTQLLAETDDGHPARSIGREVLARELVCLAPADPKHGSRLLHGEEVGRPVVRSVFAISPHTATCLSKRRFRDAPLVEARRDFWIG